MNITKEERPDVMAGKAEIVGSIPQPGEPGSENYRYRSVEVNKATEDAGRMDKHIGMGYVVAKKVGRMHIVGCPEPDADARNKKSGLKSAKRITEPAQPANRNRTSEGGRDIHTYEEGKGPVSAFEDN